MSPAQAARLLRDERRWLERSRERIRAARLRTIPPGRPTGPTPEETR